MNYLETKSIDNAGSMNEVKYQDAIGTVGVTSKMEKTKLNIHTERYDCPVIKSTVSAHVANIATQSSHSESTNPGNDQFYFKSLLDCSGVLFCGVYKKNNSRSTFTWEKCPLVPILKKDNHRNVLKKEE